MSVSKETLMKFKKDALKEYEDLQGYESIDDFTEHRRQSAIRILNLTQELLDKTKDTIEPLKKQQRSLIKAIEDGLNIIDYMAFEGEFKDKEIADVEKTMKKALAELKKL